MTQVRIAVGRALALAMLLITLEPRASIAQFTPDKDVLRAAFKNRLREVIVQNPPALGR